MAAPAVSYPTPSSSKLPSILHAPSTTVKTRAYHPLFSHPEADVVLRSNEQTLYRVDSYTLRATSGLFDTMFSLPQPRSPKCHPSPGSPFSEPLDVYEDDFVVERLLRIICGLPIPKWESLDTLERVLTAAEKWDTPGPMASIRSALSAHSLMEEHPLRCYAIAKHFEWTEEAKLASTHTLTLDLYDPAHAQILDQMCSKDVLALFNLHRKRRDMFKQLLNSPERFAAGNSTPYHCNRCGVTELDNHTWRELKDRMFLEMERRPLGDTLGLVAGDAAEWPESLACWEAKCSKPDCGGLNYDRVATLRQIRACVEVLPKTIDD